MKLMDLLRKGFGYLLMSMGVSRPGTKPRPIPKAPRDHHRPPTTDH